MSSKENELKEKPEKKATRKLAKKLDAIGWGLFFVWMGIVMMTDAGKGVVLLGIGVIILGEQTARRYFQMRIEMFWTIVGLLFLCGGLWEIYDLNAPFGALVLIIIGSLTLFSALRKEKPGKESEGGSDSAVMPEDEDSLEQQG